MQFDNEYVKRIFINQHRIERTLLAETRIQGEKLAERLGGGTAITADYMRVTVQKSVITLILSLSENSPLLTVCIVEDISLCL